uniref:Uncharacterized protein n=1 Tax=Lymantria dispar multicapsid nuclear polyhedrosis virus TaxID=10449 RepID=A0A144HWU5_NPVLD|nr:hypothetical protein [Lymantria dispar multiple nucleopolyhedrovirus]
MRQIHTHTHTTQIPLENTKFISASTDLAMGLVRNVFLQISKTPFSFRPACGRFRAARARSS